MRFSSLRLDNRRMRGKLLVVVQMARPTWGLGHTFSEPEHPF